MASVLRTNMAESPEASRLSYKSQHSSSLPPGCSNLERLPNEVLNDIIRYCEPKDNKPAMFQNLCLVSKRILPVARQELYRAASIVTYTSLTALGRTLDEKPELRQHIEELKLLVPSRGFEVSSALYSTHKANDMVLFSQYCDMLRRTNNLKSFTMILVDSTKICKPSVGTYHWFIDTLTEAIKDSQRSDSTTTAMLPQLEKARLTGDANSEPWDPELIHTELFKPFLHLPSLLSLEGTKVNDSGAWEARRPLDVYDILTGNVFEARVSRQIKSMVLSKCDCLPVDVINLASVFPDLEVLFVQRCRERTWNLGSRNIARIEELSKAPSKRRYLSDSLTELHRLEALVFLPHSRTPWQPDLMRDLLGPSWFLNLKKSCRLRLVSTLISAFASPDRSTTGQLTVSPMQVLPRSLTTLHIFVDPQTIYTPGDSARLNKALFQPRLAALQFMEELAHNCASAFPSLREVEYVWVVTRNHGKPRRVSHRSQQADHLVGTQIVERQHCDGSALLCCELHTRMQALSPFMDYTSEAEGIVSPFIERFDCLKLAFKSVGVAFEVVMLKQYSDYFFHWKQGQE